MNSKNPKLGYLIVISLFIGMVFYMNGCCPKPSISIIPRPQKITSHLGSFVLNSRTSIVADEKTKTAAEQLQTLLRPATGFSLDITTERKKIRNAILLQLEQQAKTLGTEGYSLQVMPRAVIIRASVPAGLFYAFQTLRQLLPIPIYREAPVKDIRWEIPCVKIDDYPRFAWRGAMLDSARHFMPKEFVKKFIDLLALHKLNSFHWHLTDDQGWRIEIEKYPKLTEIGAWRKETIVGHHYRDKPRKFDGKRHGGFYTQDDIREIVAYAQARHVNVVPEIEMPGPLQYLQCQRGNYFIPPGCTHGSIGTVSQQIHSYRRRRSPQGSVAGQSRYSGADPGTGLTG
jgi:hexosaminidase